jgi:hypothetical protein
MLTLLTTLHHCLTSSKVSDRQQVAFAEFSIKTRSQGQLGQVDRIQASFTEQVLVLAKAWFLHVFDVIFSLQKACFYQNR